MSQSAIAVLAGAWVSTDEAVPCRSRNWTFMAPSPILFRHDLVPKNGFRFSGSCPRRLLQAAIGRQGIVDHDLFDQTRRDPFRQRRIAIELPMRIIRRE